MCNFAVLKISMILSKGVTSIELVLSPVTKRQSTVKSGGGRKKLSEKHSFKVLTQNYRLLLELKIAVNDANLRRYPCHKRLTYSKYVFENRHNKE